MAISTVSTLYELMTFFPTEVSYKKESKSEKKSGKDVGIFPELTPVDLQIFRAASVAMSGVAMVGLASAIQAEFLAIPIVIAGSASALVVGIAFLSLTFLDLDGAEGADDSHSDRRAHIQKKLLNQSEEPKPFNLAIPEGYGESVNVFFYENNIKEAHWIHPTLRISGVALMGMAIPTSALPSLATYYEIAEILALASEIAIGSAIAFSLGLALFATSFFIIYKDVLVPLKRGSLIASSNSGAFLADNLSKNDDSILEEKETDRLLYLRPEDFWRQREVLRMQEQNTPELK